MKSPKKRTRPSQTPVVLYQRDIKRIKYEIADDILTNVSAYLMDELDYDEDKIVALWEGTARYAKAERDGLITKSKVKSIIEKHTGLKLLGYRNGRVETDT